MFKQNDHTTGSGLGSGEPDLYSVREFCCRHGLSRSHFYRLAERGDGPEVVKLGRRTLVPREGARKWRERLAQPATVLSQRHAAA